jgi:Mg/Co/Ni transporter MgtE
VLAGFLKRLPKARSEKLVDLLRYPEATVGGIMSNDMVTLTLEVSAESLPEELARIAKQLRHFHGAHP